MTNDPIHKQLRAILARLHDSTALSRMQLLGFWPVGKPAPEDPPEEVAARQAALHELANLVKLAQPGALDAALKAERERRWKASRATRALKAQQREAERLARSAAWREARKQRVDFLGHGVSAGLATAGRLAGVLEGRGLPVLDEPHALAEWLGVTLSELRWLSFHRRGAALVHYHRFGVPKKSGGIRAISAPKRRLDRTQRRILEGILASQPTHDAAHGFVPGRSILTNALPHVGRRFVLNLDLRDFFPTVTFRRVKGLFMHLGYAENVATVLALLTTEPPRVRADLDGRTLHVALGDRVLPQGACTSPAITNLLCRRLDARLAGVARALGLAYTRYADDLTFSGDDPKVAPALLRMLREIIPSEGFAEHVDKTHLMRRGARQEVTGIVVNEALRLPREFKKTLRATLCNCARFGIASQNRSNHPDFASVLRGRVAFAIMVEPHREAEWRRRLREALEGKPLDR